jgi:hypothetical protein
MPHYVCMVQEGQAADRLHDRLDGGLRRLAVETFGETAADIEIRWVPIRKGFGFTAGTDSTSSLIARGSIPTGFTDDQRTAFMRRVSELWRDVTGCHPDEVVVTTLDGPLPPL